MSTVPIYVLAGQSNANLGGIDRAIEMFVAGTGMAAEFVKFAVNGSPLSADPTRPDWDPQNTELFVDFIVVLQNAMAHVSAQGYTPELHILWIHGEGYNGTRPDPYRDKLVEFVTAVRTNMGIPDLDFTMTVIGEDSTVRTAQLQAAAILSDVRLIEPVNPGYWDGTVHYDRATRDAIAAEFVGGIAPPTVQDPAYIRLIPAFGIVHEAGRDVVTGPAYTDYIYIAPNRAQLINSFSGDDHITGSNFADTIDSGSGDDSVHGLNGDDYIVGGVHEDVLYGDGGNDVLLGGHGIDRLYGGSGTDVLAGGRQNDSLYGQGGDDTLKGGDGDDYIDGGIDIDTASYLDAEQGVTVSLMVTGPQLTGGQGTDTLRNIENLLGSLFADTLTGDAGANRLTGQDGNDRLSGLGGDDRIDGSDGNDIITGGAGRDSMSGGGGADRFIFGNGHFAGVTAATADVISDFNAAQGDRIDLRPFDAVVGTATNDAFTFIGVAAFSGTAGELRAIASGPRMLIFGDTNGDGVADFSIRLENVAAITAADFFL